MSRRARGAAALLVCVSLSSCSRGAARQQPSGAADGAVGTSGTVQNSAPAATADAAPGRGDTAGTIDQGAIRALDKMGAFLRTLKAFQIVSETTRDELLADGQPVQFGGHIDMLVQRPDRLRAEVTSDRQQRFYFYDGKSFTLWARRVNYYATAAAPNTLADLGDHLQRKYGIEMPLADLFYWGTPRGDPAAITAAVDVGASQIEGASCEHYAFRQPDVDWQLWIQPGSYPLPRKLVITTTSDPARPQFTSVMTWNLAPSYNDAAFTFEPPPDARKITFSEQPGGTSQP